MLDFTSALYLGMCHASSGLRPWSRLTTGVPAALATHPASIRVARGVASLLGCERAVLSPSTLHLFFDLFGLFPADKVIVYMDSGIYPIGRWGIERAAGRGAVVRVFPHHDADALLCLLWRDAHHRKMPVVVSDGWCPACGQFAPVVRYLSHAAEFGGRLVIDDTQALGIFGQAPSPEVPYGYGGGGTLRWFNIQGPGVIVISSLAKGFGAPIAVLAGSRATVRWFEEQSETMQHCSPPSVAVVHAAGQALFLNHEYGEVLRLHLARLVRHFRNRLARAGLSTSCGLFPFQTLLPAAPDHAAASIHTTKPVHDRKLHFHARKLHQQLLQRGIKTVLLRGSRHAGGEASQQGKSARIGFLITARHSSHDIDQAVDAIQELVDSGQRSGVKDQWTEVRR